MERRLDDVEQEHHEMSEKVDEMHAVLMHARGAKWAVFTLVGLIIPVSAGVGFIAAHWK